MKKIGIIGLFAYGVNDCGGGIIKTRNYEKTLSDRYGASNILCVDRHQANKSIIKFLSNLLKAIVSSKIIICMFSTERMIVTLAPILVWLKGIFGFKLVYVVLGGWLASFVNRNNKIQNYLSKFDVVYVETKAMERNLSEKLDNVSLMPNYSLKTPLDKPSKYISKDGIFRYCIFSRIIKEKGIEEAIDVIEKINRKYGFKVVELDIYGKVYDEYAPHFNELLKKSSDAIRYIKMLSGDEAIQTLSSYYALLFPTYYGGEGFPGTIVESFMASLPVLASDWKYNSELIDEKITGLVFRLDGDCLENTIEWTIKHQNQMNQMRINCLNKSRDYTPDRVMKDLYELIER